MNGAVQKLGGLRQELNATKKSEELHISVHSGGFISVLWRRKGSLSSICLDYTGGAAVCLKQYVTR